MLLLINCKSIYGSDLPEMSAVLKRLGHEMVVIGGPDDEARGEVERAKSVMALEKTAVSEFDTTVSRWRTMMGVVDGAEAYFGETLVVSDDPRDRAAADSLNIVTVSPFDFSFQWVGEEINGS